MLIYTCTKLFLMCFKFVLCTLEIGVYSSPISLFSSPPSLFSSPTAEPLEGLTFFPYARRDAAIPRTITWPSEPLLVGDQTMCRKHEEVSWIREHAFCKKRMRIRNKYIYIYVHEYLCMWIYKKCETTYEWI